MSKIKYSEEQVDELIKGIFEGSINLHNLPEGLYKATADYLKGGMYKGYGKTIAEVKFGSPDYALVKQLRENIYIFSAAKTHQQVREMTDAIVKGDKVVPFAEFKKSADEIFGRYNEDWLKSEYNTAVGMARNAEAWQTFEEEKEQFQMLRYNAVNDGNTCDICDPLDGITLPVDDPFWDEYGPENHFNCRCLLEQYTEDEVKKSTHKQVEKAITETSPKVTDTFRMNPGKDKVIFKEQGQGKHPYFDVEQRFHAAAQRNFNLEIPFKDDE